MPLGTYPNPYSSRNLEVYSSERIEQPPDQKLPGPLEDRDTMPKEDYKVTMCILNCESRDFQPSFPIIPPPAQKTCRKILSFHRRLEGPSLKTLTEIIDIRSSQQTTHQITLTLIDYPHEREYDPISFPVPHSWLKPFLISQGLWDIEGRQSL